MFEASQSPSILNPLMPNHNSSQNWADRVMFHKRSKKLFSKAMDQNHHFQKGEVNKSLPLEVLQHGTLSLRSRGYFIKLKSFKEKWLNNLTKAKVIRNGKKTCRTRLKSGSKWWITLVSTPKIPKKMKLLSRFRKRISWRRKVKYKRRKFLKTKTKIMPKLIGILELRCSGLTQSQAKHLLRASSQGWLFNQSRSQRVLE